MTDMETPDLHLQWADTDEGGYVNDLVGTAEQAGGDAHEPVDTLALACTAAFASEALGKALDHPWALYTPQDAAVVASALHAQVEATIENYRRLAAAVESLGARGDVSIPEPSGLVSPTAENLADALDRLRGIADELEYPLASMATATATLNRTPALFERPAGTHDTLRAVAALLGDGTTIAGQKPDGDHEDGQCTCTLEIARGSDRYFLFYDDLGWKLLRDSDGRARQDGAKVWAGGTDPISLQEERVHPAQLAQQVEAAIGGATAE